MTATGSLATREFTPIEFLEALLLDDGRALGDALEPWQRDDVLAPIYDPRYRLVDIELARGHAKTAIVAAVAVEHLRRLMGARLFAFASDEDQAALLHEAAAGFIARSGDEFARTFDVDRRTIRDRKTGSLLRVMASDAVSAYGLLGDLFIVDEIASLRDRALWDAVYTAMAKKRTARIIVIGTPGWSRSSIAWEVREAARTAEGYYLFAPGRRLASWLDEAELDRQRVTLPPHVFKRQHLGQWSEGEGAFITTDDLARCVRPELAPRARCGEGWHVLAVDLGLTVDRTSTAVVHRTDRGARLEQLRVWQGTKDSPVGITTEVEPFMRDVVLNFSNLQIVMDPWQARSTYERFVGHVPISQFIFQGGPIDEMTRALYALAHEGALELYPDPDLERELLDVQIVEKSYGVRIDHRRGHHDDRVIALGLACHAAMQIERAPELPSYRDPRTGDYITAPPDHFVVIGPQV